MKATNQVSLLDVIVWEVPKFLICSMKTDPQVDLPALQYSRETKQF